MGESIELEKEVTCECVKTKAYNIKLNITLHLLFPFQLNQSLQSTHSNLLISIKFISKKVSIGCYTANNVCLSAFRYQTMYDIYFIDT